MTETMYERPGAGALASFTAQAAIDVTAFLGQWPFRMRCQSTAADLTVTADRLGLAALYVSHIGSIFGHDTRTGNEELFLLVRADARLRPMALLNPDEPGWEYELDWAVASGARGVRLAPGYHGYRLTDAAVGSMLDATRELTLPIHVCIRLEDERVRHPRYCVVEPTRYEIAEFVRRAASDQPVILSGIKLPEWREVLHHLGDAPIEALAADLWFVNGPHGAIESLGEGWDLHHFCYGSATPLQTAEATALQLAVASLDQPALAALSRGNAIRLLGE